MVASQRVVACMLLALALPAAGAQDSRRTPFTHFGARPALELRGDGATATVDFGQRADELVTAAQLRMRYATSLALAPGISHLRVTLNDQVIGTLPVSAAEAGKPVLRELSFDPRLIVGFNKLVITLVAAPGSAPSPDRPGLWADVSGTSEIELALRPLAVADELASLPEPFFDRHDERRVTIPFVFAAQPSHGTLRSAAAVASWFGGLARWRGVRFPAYLDAPAPGHGVAFATNAERPAFLASLPPATGPQLRVMANPADNRSKLLLVMGRDAADLQAAVRTLVAGGAPLSGASVQVKQAEEPAARAAWDAANLVRMDRPMKFAELVDGPQQLEVTGRAPQLPPIRIDLRVPPDLVNGSGAGVPVNLKVNYTPPACAAETYLDVGLDDELVEVLPMRTAYQPMSEARELFIPPSRWRPRSRLQLALRFAMKEDPGCLAPRADIVKVAVSLESTIDFTGLAHRATLPALEHFAAIGYPFTRHADLSQTVVVMPQPASAPDITTLLALMGRMGEATGVPATRVRVVGPRDDAAFADADLLVIGTTPQQALLDRWAEAVPIAMAGYSRRVNVPVPRHVALKRWLGFRGGDDAGAMPVSFEGSGPLAAIFGFESPVTSGRSVVAVTAVVPEQMARVLDVLDDGDLRREVRGSVAFMLPNRVQWGLLGPTYTTGSPSWASSWGAVGAAVVVLGTAVLGLVLIFRKRRRAATPARSAA